MDTIHDIFYLGNFVINNEEEIVKVTGLHYNNSLFVGKFIKSKYITRLLITNALFVKSSFKQYKSPEMELKVTKDKVLEAASKCSTAKETLKTLFPEAFKEEDEKKKQEADKQMWDQIRDKLALFLSSLNEIKPLNSYEYRFLSKKLDSHNISDLIINFLKNHKKEVPVDYDKLVKINEFTADFCPTRPIFIDNGASGNIKFHNKVFLLNPDWNWTIMKAHDGNTSFRDILIPTLK